MNEPLYKFMYKKTPLKLLHIIIIVISSIGLLILADEKAYPVFAQAETTSPIAFSQESGGHADCLSCHGKPNMIGRFADGKTISLYYDPKEHDGSDHVAGCLVCHDAQKEYPHKDSEANACSICHSQIVGGNEQDALVFEIISYPDERSVSMEINSSCKKCHKEKFQEITDSEHTRVLERGNRYAPICVDCHGSHNITSPNEPRTKVAQICNKCHMSVYTTYESSVHGAALKADSNPDVPTCNNCHGSHKVQGPENINFRADSITLCGNCHADKTLMEKYGLSTDVFQTYLDDFHGRTVDFLRKKRNVIITKATCYDCHGVHNIQSPKNELSSVYPANLQKTCQQCHPNAGITFPQAWLSHYSPNWEKTPLLFGITTFYKFLIPTIVGGFVVYIAIDARRRIADKFRKPSSKSVEASELQETGKQDEKV
jgi:predicted CXXCH cytochrome family protein